MDTYTVLLVDDEEEVLQAIRRKINWEGLGFSVIGFANNGVKALEMVEEFQPDVVLTDIKMPYMDGMELANVLRRSLPPPKSFSSQALMSLNMQKRPSIWRWRNIFSSL